MTMNDKCFNYKANFSHKDGHLETVTLQDCSRIESVLCPEFVKYMQEYEGMSGCTLQDIIVTFNKRKKAKTEPHATTFRVHKEKTLEFFQFILDRWGAQWYFVDAKEPDGTPCHRITAFDIPQGQTDMLDFVILYFDK